MRHDNVVGTYIKYIYTHRNAQSREESAKRAPAEMSRQGFSDVPRERTLHRR